MWCLKMSAEHAELVMEMAEMEKMSHVDKVKHAKKRRAQQLKYYQKCEKGQDDGKGTKAKYQRQKIQKQNKERMESIKELHFTKSVLLFDSAVRNDLEEAEHLLQSGIDPNVCGEDSLTVLHQCCLNDLLDMMKMFLRHKADVNKRDCDQWTPLHLAATCGNITLCQCLCESNADLLALNTDGNMPYDLCDDVPTLDFIEIEMAKKGITQELIDETRLSSENKMMSDLIKFVGLNGDLNTKGDNGETLLHIASCCGYSRVIEYLIGKKVLLNGVDDEGWSALHMATYYGQYHVLESLLLAGADSDAKTLSAETMLDLCDIETQSKIEALLLDIKSRNFSKLSAPSTMERHNSSRRGSQATLHTGRRSSIHDKASIAHKDVIMEAQTLQRTMISKDDDDDDDDKSSPHTEIDNSTSYVSHKVPLTSIDLSKKPSKSILKKSAKPDKKKSNSDMKNLEIWKTGSSSPNSNSNNPFKSNKKDTPKKNKKDSLNEHDQKDPLSNSSQANGDSKAPAGTLLQLKNHRKYNRNSSGSKQNNGEVQGTFVRDSKKKKFTNHENAVEGESEEKCCIIL